MDSNALTIFERQLEPLEPRLTAALAGMMPTEKLIQSVLISIERTPQLAKCTPDSILRASLSAACIGLPIDGVTGQAYMIPFKDHGVDKAQLVIGYAGFNTLAARGDMTIDGQIVREGDLFEYELGTNQYVRHKPDLSGQGRIVGAWASATHKDRPPIIVVMSIDEINAIKARAPGSGRKESPWNDPAVGFPAMASKTAKRRLRRSLPMDYDLRAFHLAARMDEAVEEQGQAATIDERGVEIEGKVEQLGKPEPSKTPRAESLTGPDVVETVRKIAKEEGPQAAQAYYDTLPDEDQRRIDAHRKSRRRS